MKILLSITLVFIAWSAAYGMDIVDTCIESDISLSSDKPITLLFDKNNKPLNHRSLTEWAHKVKNEKATHSTETHLIELFWQFTTISICVQNNKLDNAYSCLRVIKSLYKEATHYKNSILNDTWTECLKIEDDPFLEGLIKNEYYSTHERINPENDSDSFFKLNQETTQQIFNDIYDQYPEELVTNYQNMLKKVVLAGATLNGCKPSAWKKSVEIKEFASQKKEFQSIKTKKDCVIN